ncbi:hypothetical protein M3Y94_00180200 [Aphelenchoides besseyi]|nr:hypothetical protein M3Y94_00180200 [Aphelenchoides besseyi]
MKLKVVLCSFRILLSIAVISIATSYNQLCGPSKECAVSGNSTLDSYVDQRSCVPLDLMRTLKAITELNVHNENEFSLIFFHLSGYHFDSHFDVSTLLRQSERADLSKFYDDHGNGPLRVLSLVRLLHGSTINQRPWKWNPTFDEHRRDQCYSVLHSRLLLHVWIRFASLALYSDPVEV